MEGKYCLLCWKNNTNAGILYKIFVLPVWTSQSSLHLRLPALHTVQFHNIINTNAATMQNSEVETTYTKTEVLCDNHQKETTFINMSFQCKVNTKSVFTFLSDMNNK
jgi:hypothetical protein